MKDSIKHQAKMAAAHLSHFNGENPSQSNRSNFEGYEGGNIAAANQGDGLVQFSGGVAGGFRMEGQGARTFGFEILNATSGSLAFALTPTYLGTAAAIATATGETINHLVTDGTITANVTGTSKNPKLTIANWQSFHKQNPGRISEMIIESNSDATFSRSIAVHVISPYGLIETKYIDLTQFIDPTQYNTKKARINVLQLFDDLQLNDQTALIFTVGGTNVVATTGERVSFTFKVGSVFNGAGLLKSKAENAKRAAIRG